MAVMFLISALAETQRAPFDLTEAESELVAGYQTEYSSMSFALFWLGEYANVILMCALNATLFWGGGCRRSTGRRSIWCRGSSGCSPRSCSSSSCSAGSRRRYRYRYDQLMRLGWKVFLPVSLFWVFLVSGVLMYHRVGI